MKVIFMMKLIMNKINWSILEQWSTAKYLKFGGEGWLDLVMLCVAKQAEFKHKVEWSSIIKPI